jgi:hypothetical protein
MADFHELVAELKTASLTHQMRVDTRLVSCTASIDLSLLQTMKVRCVFLVLPVCDLGGHEAVRSVNHSDSPPRSIPNLNFHTVPDEDSSPVTTRASGRRSRPTSARGLRLTVKRIACELYLAHLSEHKFRKVNFSNPTWCVFTNTFIWGLDKTGYECTST